MGAGVPGPKSIPRACSLLASVYLKSFSHTLPCHSQTFGALQPLKASLTSRPAQRPPCPPLDLPLQDRREHPAQQTHLICLPRRNRPRRRNLSPPHRPPRHAPPPLPRALARPCSPQRRLPPYRHQRGYQGVDIVHDGGVCCRGDESRGGA